MPINLWHLAEGDQPAASGSRKCSTTERLQSDQDVVRLIEDRLPTDALDGAPPLRRRRRRDLRLILPRRTLTAPRRAPRAVSASTNPTASSASRASRRSAKGVFGESARFWRWFRAPKRQFGGRSPLSLLTTAPARASSRSCSSRSTRDSPRSRVILWRISNHISLDGAGALRGVGRWHSPGRRIVYCAGVVPPPRSSRSLVHFDDRARHDLPARYRLLKIAVPDEATSNGSTSPTLPVRWIERDDGDAGDRRYLDRRQAGRALLAVPSAIVPRTDERADQSARIRRRRSIVRVDVTSEHVIDARSPR